MNASQGIAEAFLNGLRSGEWDHMAQLYAENAVYDGTVPQWHFGVRGPGPIVDELRKWFPMHGRLSDVQLLQTSEGLALSFERHWDRPNTATGDIEEVGIRQAHFLRLEDQRIIRHRAFCAGIWDAATFAEIEASAPKP